MSFNNVLTFVAVSVLYEKIIHVYQVYRESELRAHLIHLYDHHNSGVETKNRHNDCCSNTGKKSDKCCTIASVLFVINTVRAKVVIFTQIDKYLLLSYRVYYIL